MTRSEVLKYIVQNKRNIAKYVVFIFLIILAINVKTILYYATGSTTPIAVVKGYSMYPLLREGDIVFTHRVDPSNIHVGDVIIYKSRTGNLIIHRVINVIVRNNTYYYETKGDNNPIPDYPEFQHYGIPYNRVEGVVVKIGNSVFKIQYLGYLSIWFHGG